jgi:hypothetical protein
LVKPRSYGCIDQNTRKISVGVKIVRGNVCVPVDRSLTGPPRRPRLLVARTTSRTLVMLSVQVFSNLPPMGTLFLDNRLNPFDNKIKLTKPPQTVK